MRLDKKDVREIMRYDEETREKIAQLVRLTNARNIIIHVHQPTRQKRPVAGFPFSLIEQFLNGALNLTSRAIERLVSWAERQFS